ncbi:MAG: hypothetical protein B6247_08215 [Candidatus Parabeggiatoa sp. nov. 2]|nr:MAG: hypothetical protein B6247_08215 [Beggiatoa sp. 4572_84]
MPLTYTHTLLKPASLVLRFAIWVQGCPLRCPSCMTPAALPESGGELMTISKLAQRILLSQTN